IDFDWEHISEVTAEIRKLRLQGLAEIIVKLRKALDLAGLSCKTVSYTPRYNAFFPFNGSTTIQSQPKIIVPHNTNAEGLDLVKYIDASQFKTNPKKAAQDIISYCGLMMYDISAQDAFNAAHNPSISNAFSMQHYIDTLQSWVSPGLFKKTQVVMGFEPGPNAATGVWGGIPLSKSVTDYIKLYNYGGVMFWALNDINKCPKPTSPGGTRCDPSVGNTRTTGENSLCLAKYAAGGTCS
ncbi:MAG: hypothetical protein QF704_16580, partial [Anaerolineales bacterium]|nr:hypothetical protein [Anaerolineales bacterium]